MPTIGKPEGLDTMLGKREFGSYFMHHQISGVNFPAEIVQSLAPLVLPWLINRDKEGKVQ